VSDEKCRTGEVVNATKTYKKTADNAQAWAEGKAREFDVDGLISTAERKAQQATTWVADTSADAAHKAGDWLEQMADSAADWLEDQSEKAVAMVPAVAAKRKRARRRNWLIGSGVALALLFYFYDPDKGRARRAKLKNLFSRNDQPQTTTNASFSTQTVNEAKAEDLEPESVN
jgi:hypothetical protein